MSITEFTFRLLFIFFPGIIAFFIIDDLTFHRKREGYLVILRSFIFGILSYTLLYVIHYFYAAIAGRFGIEHKFVIQIFEAVSNDKSPVNYPEIIWATLIAVPLSLVVSVTQNKKWFHRLAKKCKITRKSGDLDLWNFVLESPDTEWVVVRDIKNNLAYQGRIQGFSETFVENEILLRDVLVLQNDTGESLYNIDALYLSRDPKDLTVEFAIKNNATKPNAIERNEIP